MGDEKVWYAFHSGEYEGNLPRFFDPNDFGWTSLFQDCFDSIRAEATKLATENGELFIPYYREVTGNRGRNWSTLTLYLWQRRNQRLHGRGTVLDSCLRTIPGFVSASISKLDPGQIVHWHRGDTSGTVRCHFPLVVPAGLPDCGFQVEGEKRSWIEGKFLMFCDAYRHRAFNYTDQERLILIIDIVNPRFADLKNRISATALSIIWVRRLMWVVPGFGNSPDALRRTVRTLLEQLIYGRLLLNAVWSQYGTRQDDR